MYETQIMQLFPDPSLDSEKPVKGPSSQTRRSKEEEQHVEETH